jgi:polyferredoxin
MDKMGYARGLIRYSSEHAMARGDTKSLRLTDVLRPRVAAYGALIVVLAGALAAGVYLRNPLKVDVIRDRGALMRDTADGRVENVYRLQIMNTSEQARRFVVSASGLPGLEVVAEQPVRVGAAVTEAVAVAVRADPAVVSAGSHPIVFHVRDVDDEGVSTNEKSRFFVR